VRGKEKIQKRYPAQQAPRASVSCLSLKHGKCGSHHSTRSTASLPLERLNVLSFPGHLNSQCVCVYLMGQMTACNHCLTWSSYTCVFCGMKIFNSSSGLEQLMKHNGQWCPAPLLAAKSQPDLLECQLQGRPRCQSSISTALSWVPHTPTDEAGYHSPDTS
jgi:hypothetical protein